MSMEKIPKRAEPSDERADLPPDEPQADIVPVPEAPEMPAVDSVIQEIQNEENMDRVRNRQIRDIKHEIERRRRLN